VQPLSVPHRPARRAFTGQLARFVGVVASLDDHRLLTASRCHGWTVLDAAVHVRAGLQEMLEGVTAPTDAQPSRDAASYWAGGVPTDGGDAVDGILWTRRTASAYRRPSTAVRHLQAVADAVHRGVETMADARVAFQGHVLTTGDFLATWAVELAVHHVDLMLHLDLEPPTADALSLTRRTVEALAESAMPATWSDLQVLLVGTGRTGPGADLPAAVAGRLPVLG
jgi:hypothetical protein